MSTTQIALLKNYGLHVRGLQGQHLLIDPNVQRKIVALVDPQPREWILEIGPGLGALTGEMLAAGAGVIAVEKDRHFSEILEKEWGAVYKGKFFVENADILKTDLGKLLKKSSPHPNPLPLRGEGKVTKGRVRGIKVVSNLPYYITSPILFWLIAHRAHVKKAVLTMQKEVANRLLAQPGNKDYGRLTLAIRYYAQVHRAFDISRNSFTPRPDVDSSVLTLDFHPASSHQGVDEGLLFQVIRVAFGARRKTLLNRLTHDVQIGKSRLELEPILKQLGIPPNARAEELLLKDFISLAESLRAPRSEAKQSQRLLRRPAVNGGAPCNDD